MARTPRRAFLRKLTANLGAAFLWAGISGVAGLVASGASSAAGEGGGQVRRPIVPVQNEDVRSYPNDLTPYWRSPVSEDLAPGGKPAIPPGLSIGQPGGKGRQPAPGTSRPEGAAPGSGSGGSGLPSLKLNGSGPAIFLADPIVSNTNANLTNTDTANDGETSIAVNPANTNEIVISAFSGGWGGGTANAVVYHSLDGGLTWTQRGVPPPVNIPVTGPNDWAFDYGRGNRMSGTVLNNGDIITGTTTNPASVAAWNWNNAGTPPTTQITNINVATSVGNSDQPWLLVNRNTANAAQDDVFVAYDDFGGAPDMRVAVSAGVNPPNFLTDVNVGFSTGGVNPGLRLAKDPGTGFMYALWQRCTANCNTDNAKTIDFMLNLSTDGGATWSLNGNANGIVVASGDSLQPRPKFGTVNALLGGINHAAVDPATGVLYYVYGDRDVSGVQRIALRRVAHNGTGANNVVLGDTSWVSPDTNEAAIPSAAIIDDGTLGVFYYTFDGFSSGGFPIFTAWLALSQDEGQTFSQHRLLTFLSSATDDGVANSRQRVLGDYMQMKAVGNCFYGAFTGNGVAFGRPIANHDPIFFKTCMGPQVQVSQSLTMPQTCSGSASSTTLNVCNTGLATLVVSGITSSNARFSVTPTSGGFPVNISPDFCFPFNVNFSPTAGGVQNATLSIASNDPSSPASVTVSGTAQVPALTATLESNGNFGMVPAGASKVLNLEVLNESNVCNAVVSSLARTTGDAEFSFAGLASGFSFPVTLPPGASLDLPIAFSPVTFGVKAATFGLMSNDPDDSPATFGVTGNSEAPDIAVSGDLGFGAVCAGTNAERTVQVCNVGTLNTLNVTSATLVGAGCGNFAIVGNPFPASVSHDFCIDLHVAYTPTGVGSHNACNLVINTNDPDEPQISLPLTGSTPGSVINVAGDQSFPATVNQSLGTWSSLKGFPIQNNGSCPLTITQVAVTSGDYALRNLPSVPTSLLPGELFGDGALDVAFSPTRVERHSVGEVAVTYVTDPFAGTTATVTRAMCGEGVNTGARVLVTSNGLPLARVDRIQLQRINANRNSRNGLLDTIDVSRDVALQSVAAASACPGFSYHKEYGSVSNPIQLLPGSYQVTVQTRIGNRNVSKTVGFDVSTCGFNSSVIVNF